MFNMNVPKYNGQKDFEWAVNLNRFALELTMRKIQDVMLMIDNLQYTFVIIIYSIRIVIFWWKKQAIVPIVSMIADDWMKEKDTRERDIMIGKAQIARTIITCSYTLMGIAYLFVIVLPILGVSMSLSMNITDPGRPLPLQAHIISDVRDSPQYEITFIGQALYLIFAIMSSIGIDNFLGLLVFHICGQFDILKSHLVNLNKYAYIRNALKHCVLKHIQLLRAIDMIEDTYNMIFLVLFAYFGIIFALYGYRIMSLFEGNDLPFTRLLFLVSTLFNIFLHMCLYCIIGDVLETQCNGLHFAAYNNEWYTMNSKVAKDLMPLLIKGTKPVFLTAGKIFPITMTTFCNLVKTSAGYISVLHTMRS